MYERILFPTDGSDGANAVLDYVLDIAERNAATLHVLHVTDSSPLPKDRRDEVGAILESEGQQIVDATAERASERDVTVLTDVQQGAVPETITAYAEEFGIDVIVMPTHGRTGLQRILLGSVTERVLRQALVPVLTVRPDTESRRYPYRNVLVPTDGSECAHAALDHGVGLAKAHDATLHLFSAVDVTGMGIGDTSYIQVDLLEEQATKLVASAAESATRASVESVVEATDVGSSIHRMITEYAETKDVDLVVMGTHGRTGLDRLLLGSVTEKTVRTSPVPVLTVPEP